MSHIDTHLSLSSCCIKDWAFSEKSIYILAIYFLQFTFLQTINPKKYKTAASFIGLLVKLANQCLQLLVGSITFSILKGTTIDLLHLGVIRRATKRAGVGLHLPSSVSGVDSGAHLSGLGRSQVLL